MSAINKHLGKIGRACGHNFPHVICADGFTVSIQASEFYYCFPRKTFTPDETQSYHSFELGFPSAADDLIQQYAEEPETPTDTIYSYVPAEIVDALIAKHGGIAV